MTSHNVPEALLAKIRSGNRFLLTCHVNPDGDAIGSELGMARVLRKLGKGSTIWNRDPTPKVYTPLPGSASIHVGSEPPAGFPELYSAAIVLECPSPERCGHAEALADLEVINIDHHLGNGLYGAVNWVDTAAPAVGEMVYRIATALNLGIDEDTANTLYLTLVTDTGGFRYSNTTPETFESAAALLRAGASPDLVSGWLYDSQPEAGIRLLGEMLGTLELHDQGRIATAWLTQEMMQRCNAEMAHTEGLIDTPRSIAGVEAVALFREVDGGGFKASLRSAGSADVEKIARSFGGGGHHNAAGFSFDGERETLFKDTLDGLRASLTTAPQADSSSAGDSDGAAE